MQTLRYINLVSSILKGDPRLMEEVLRTEPSGCDDFYRFVRSNHIAGTMYSILSSSEFRTLFPEELIERLKSSYLEQWVKNEKLLKETEMLSELFGRASEEVIFLKGAFLAERYYGNIDMRAISDIDLLIRKDWLERADRTLKGFGYVRKSHAFPSKAVASLFTHHFEYRENGIDLDLHWNLSSHFTFKIDYRRLWRDSRQFEFRRKGYRVLSDEYELVFQILSIFKDIELGTIKLKSFVDAYMIMRLAYGRIGWVVFFERRRSEGIFKITLNILDLFLALFNSREEFPEISAYIDDNAECIGLIDLEEKLSLITRAGFSLRNKRWALGLYSANPFNSFLWWLISIPFKLQVYRQGGHRIVRGRRD
ncbi:MAG: nucleotidyltransferase family protein [Thermodesulfobacteriota bacterium]